MKKRPLFRTIGLLGVCGGTILAVFAFLVLSRSATSTPQDQQMIGVATLPLPVLTTQPLAAVISDTSLPVPMPSLTPLPMQEEKQADYGVWQYKAGKSIDLGAHAVITYDQSSVEALQGYAAANHTLAKQVAAEGGTVQVHITFRDYMAPDQFRTWVKSKGLTVLQTELRAIDAKGMPGTLGVYPQGDDPLPQTYMSQGLEPQKQLAGDAGTLAGVFYTYATVDAANLLNISEDPLVFIADVTPNVVRRELITSGWLDVKLENVNVDPPHAFWEMERLGLENFAK